MDQSSQKKVAKRGFIILRCDDQPTPRIKYKDKDVHEWRTFERFVSKAARDRAFKSLLDNNENFISD